MCDWLGSHALEGTVGALSLQRRANLSIDQFMLLGVRDELLLEALGGIASEHSTAAWLLNFGCWHNVVHAIGLRVNGCCAVAATELSGLGEPAVRLVEAEVCKLLGPKLPDVDVWHEGLSAALPSIDWHILIRVGF